MKVPCGDRTNTIHNSAQSKNAKSKCPMMTRKRKLQLMDIAVNKNNVQSTPIAGRLFSSETMRDDRLSHVYLGTCCRDAHVVDTRDRENLMLSSPVLSPKCHAPLVVTPDRRLDKPTAFISPITRTIQSASEVIQVYNNSTSNSNEHLTSRTTNSIDFITPMRSKSTGRRDGVQAVPLRRAHTLINKKLVPSFECFL